MASLWRLATQPLSERASSTRSSTPQALISARPPIFPAVTRSSSGKFAQTARRALSRQPCSLRKHSSLLTQQTALLPRRPPLLTMQGRVLTSRV